MPTASANFSFTIENNAACWTGLDPCAFELKLAKALPSYALEQLRTRFFYAVTTNHLTVKSVRAAIQMAYDTEAGVTLTKVITIPSDVLTALVCERRSYLDTDASMKPYDFMYLPALKEAVNLGVLPQEYVDLFQRFMQSDYARYRMSGVSALLCHAAQALVP